MEERVFQMAKGSYVRGTLTKYRTMRHLSMAELP